MTRSKDERLGRLREALLTKRSASLNPPASRRAAVAVVLRDEGRGLEILFIRRAEHPQDPWSGQIAFPGGRFEPGDADLRATAIRETFDAKPSTLAREGSSHNCRK